MIFDKKICLCLAAMTSTLLQADAFSTRLSVKSLSVNAGTKLEVTSSGRPNRRKSFFDENDYDTNSDNGWSESSSTNNRRQKYIPSDDYTDDDFSGDDDWSRPAKSSHQQRRGGRQNSKNSGRGRYRENSGRKQKQSSDSEEKITDVNAHFFSKKNLKDPSFKTSQDLFLPLCEGAGITRPSRIQSLSWPQILDEENNHILIADQTGSGKTLAYLLPLLQKALQTEGNQSAKGAPKLLILAPTAELADQIHSVCNKIADKVPFSSMVVTATGKYTTSIRDQIRIIQRESIDVMISTPGRLSTILRTRNSGLDLSYLQSIVLDEVDILLIDDTFGPQLRTVGEAAPMDKTQFVFVTATLPDKVVKTVQEEFPGVQQIKGPGLHRISPSLKEILVDVSVPATYNRDASKCFDVKAKALLKALRQTRCRRTLVFCNTVDSCRTVENLLNRRDRRGRVYQVGSYHNAMSAEARNANLEDFANARDDVDAVLICTDRAARGVDFEEAPVDHVVVFDFPKDPAEYIRRVGRTGRAGRKGTSTVFAYGWQLPIARTVMGSKLDSFSMINDDQNDDVNDKRQYEYRQHRRNKKKTKSAEIKANIEGGTLWE